MPLEKTSLEQIQIERSTIIGPYLEIYQGNQIGHFFAIRLFVVMIWATF